ncbi:S-adenosylmethionine decarboxylase proenzyme 4 [Striga hermonthica]|uniref:adenosylmethionine decarboxylase n=1 Tax=Striga hermonthica TaxID=68872 RepID=A0A9N7RF01_STRHE|nr:S-adenosylmethionine decarboxylase proenzyme 4 [Striga hermonthica]
MAVSGFEGFEKRLEIHFSGDDPAALGLRQLDFPSLEKILHAVQCTVVSAVGNAHFDSYVLSESSLFVYPTKIVIKTCGTTQLLKSVRPFIDHGISLGLTLLGCRYTRGSFIFPLAQPYPHTSFKNEVIYLEANLPKNLTHKKATTMNSKSNHKWHVFTAFVDGPPVDLSVDDSYTVEICMTELDPTLARNFFRYASFECVGSSRDGNILEVLKRVVRIFGPGKLSVSTTAGPGVRNRMWRGMARAVEPLGMRLTSSGAREFPNAGSIVFQTFVADRK